MPDNNYFIGIDVGTTYVKSVIINSTREIVNYFVKRTGTSLEDSSKLVPSSFNSVYF